MIIHKEQVDYKFDNGNIGKKLIISYIDKEGNVKFLQYPIPPEQMFEWKYATKTTADPPFKLYDYKTNQFVTDEKGFPVYKQWKSYDNKYVKKHPVEKLPEFRINELLNSFGDAVNPIFEMNIPNTWWCDIEVDVTEDGFPEPEDATTQINTI